MSAVSTVLLGRWRPITVSPSVLISRFVVVVFVLVVAVLVLKEWPC